MQHRLSLADYLPHDNAPLCRLLTLHSEQVRDRALSICRRHPELGADEAFVSEAAMLHDVGIIQTDAPAIHCHGREPYLRHGLLGARLMRQAGREDLARVCERHTGTGLSREQIEEQRLPLPPRDLLPETLEEQIICYADKFYSKSHPEAPYTPQVARAKVARFGEQGLARFDRWQQLFD